YKVMPALLDELEAAGVSLDDVTLVFGLGSHRKQTALGGSRSLATMSWILSARMT
ncbi:MAG: DUF2088 domain-containing protein, partial [Kiritimatiellae bacterium]|nr:DUF2088 domain-containing protein [Kiritimatiellia bacterium]